MEALSEWDLAASAADRLRRREASFRHTNDGDAWFQQTIAALEALGPRPCPEAARRIWQGASWKPLCDECGSAAERVVVLGGRPANTVFSICPPCLLKALRVMDDGV